MFQSSVLLPLLLLLIGAFLLYYLVIRPGQSTSKSAQSKERKQKQPNAFKKETQVKVKKKVDPNSPEGMSIRFQYYLEKTVQLEQGVVLKRWPSNPTSYYPDLQLSRVTQGKETNIAIECKFRTGLENGFVSFAYDDQLKRYKQFEEQSKIPVIVVLGLGGTPEAPNNVYEIPLAALHQPYVGEQLLEEFEMENNSFTI